MGDTDPRESLQPSPDPSTRAKVRTLDVRPVTQDGHAFLALRDPLRLSDQTLLLPQRYAPALALCDGTRDPSAVSASLAVRFGLSVPAAEIERLLQTLDKAYLLENARFAEARECALAAFRNAPFRLAMDSGISYPAEPDDLHRLLLRFGDQAQETAPGGDLRGLVCPHIDFARGGSVYARIWARASEAMRQAETVILLGTDHYGEDGTWTLTRQNYSTPFGVLPTDQVIVSRLAEAIGEAEAFEGELRHRGEHSIELAAVWLHFARERRPCALVPVLCGSFGRFFRGEGDPGSDERIQKIGTVLQPLIAGGKAIVVAAADLSHVGPAFGGSPLDLVSRGRLQSSDDELIRFVCAGDAKGFFEAIRRVEDRNNVCGASAIYLALKALEPVQGETVAYDRCPADTGSTSMVSICGVLLR